jgi:hypothetical protein
MRFVGISFGTCFTLEIEMHFDKDQLTKFMERLKVEGNPQIFLSPVESMPANLVLPRAWSDLLVMEDAHRSVVKSLWSEGAEVLPTLTSAIERSVQAVGLLVTDLKEASLIYVFTKGDSIFARRGFLPCSTLPPINSQLSPDLSTIYRIHNGWIDLMSYDTGPLPTDQWYTVGNSQPSLRDGLLIVFRTGGNVMGFDLSERPANPYILWSGGKVEKVDDFWEELDSWLSIGIEKMDKNAADLTI